MGVRFQCPNGHQLNVKADLIGKRGICPDCGAKFIVPSFSGGRVPPAGAASPTDGDSGPASRWSAAEAATIGAETAPPPAEPSPAPAAHAESAAWYVRPAGGGQFGPASTEVFQQWIAEGRVAADSWVWRTGWAAWKGGGEILAQTADQPPLGPALAMAAAHPADATSAGAVQTHVEPGSAAARREEIKRRKQHVRKLSALLGLVVLALLILLVVVLAG
jgi:hypothetical protein